MPAPLKRIKDVVIVKGTEGRNPFEVLILVWAVFTGASLLFGAPVPGSVQALLPRWVVITWYTLLCIGGLVGLVGVWLGDVIASLLVERAGMMFIAPAGLLYAAALYNVSDSRGIIYGSSVAAFSIGAAVRLVRITWHLKSVRSGGKT